MRVSVVVPVFDPGRYLADLVASLDAQTLGPEQFEVVFVDDGSTDGSGAFLDDLAAARPNVRVVHLPPSGWPGRPRNVGIDLAVGTYVFLADHDDRLAPEALERLADFADEHGSDVVLGRVVGVGRSAPERIFARTVVDAQADWGLLFTSLTPQKLYRRAFLDERRIRFPEGRRRLEDHLFVTTAYLRAARVSVLAGRAAYFFVLRDDGSNASRRPIEWPAYFANAAESVAVVDAEAPDEAARVVIRRRWLRTEAVGRLRGRRYAERADRGALTSAVRDFVRQHYPAAELERLGPADRLAARLLVEDRDDDLVALARWEAGLRLRPTVESAAVGPDGLLRLRIMVRQASTTERPALPADVLDGLERVPTGLAATVGLRAGGEAVEAAVSQRVAEGVLRIEATVVGSDLLPGRWAVRVALTGRAGVRADRPAAAPALPPASARLPGRRLRIASVAGGVEVRVGSTAPLARPRRAARALLRRLRALR